MNITPLQKESQRAIDYFLSTNSYQFLHRIRSKSKPCDKGNKSRHTSLIPAKKLNKTE